MNESPGVLSPGSLPRPGEVALLTAISAVLDVPADELRGRFALVRRYIGAAPEAVPGRPARHVPGGRADARPRRQPRQMIREGAPAWAGRRPWSWRKFRPRS